MSTRAVAALILGGLLVAGPLSCGSDSPAGPPAVARVTLVVPSDTLKVGQSVTVTATAVDAGGTVLARSITYSSSNMSAATVSAAGVVLAVAPGSTTITAAAEGQTASHAVTVLAPPVAAGPGRIVIGPGAGWVARGVPYTLALTAYDAAGRAVSDPSVTLASSDASIATVSPAGVVQPLALGTVTISASSADGKTGTATLVVAEKRTLVGTVATADGSPPGDLRFSARIGGLGASQQLFTTAVNPSTGQYALDMPAMPAAAGTLELFVDAAPGTARRMHPSYIAVNAATTLPAPFTVLLLPEVMTPDAGAYAGRSVPISVVKAFTPVCTVTSDANCQSYWPSYFNSGIKMWPDEARPTPLAIDRTGAASGIGAADSVGLWFAIRQMEADLGRHLYEPATFSAYTTTGYQSGTVLVTVDPTVGASHAYTNWSWTAQGDIFQARTRFGSVTLMSNAGLVAHELNHAQGLHHTCQWATVMGGYGCGSVSRYSESDAAYYQLAQLVRRRTRELLPVMGLVEALNGERVLEQGVTFASVIPQSLQALRTRIPVAGADSSGFDAVR